MLSLATYPLRSGGKRCSHIPVNALNDLGPQDAVLYMQEPEYVENLPPRPATFSVQFSTASEYAFEVSIFRCLKAKNLMYAMVPFEDEGRNFFAFLAIGLQASDETRKELLSVLNSLRIIR